MLSFHERAFCILCVSIPSVLFRFPCIFSVPRYCRKSIGNLGGVTGCGLFLGSDCHTSRRCTCCACQPPPVAQTIVADPVAQVRLPRCLRRDLRQNSLHTKSREASGRCVQADHFPIRERTHGFAAGKVHSTVFAFPSVPSGGQVLLCVRRCPCVRTRTRRRSSS